jgi:Flp pilus assembly protein TadD
MSAFGAGLLVVLSGCMPRTGGAEALRAYTERDPYRAGQLNGRGLALIEEGGFAEAEARFREAIAADPFHGPSHCNLGIVLLQQDRYYDAATELQFACKLMPKASQPRHNLGILFEKVGRYEQADEELHIALDLNPDDIEIIGHLARVHIRQGDRSEKVRRWLAAVALRDQGPAWNAWARQELTKFGESGNEQGAP